MGRSVARAEEEVEDAGIKWQTSTQASSGTPPAMKEASKRYLKSKKTENLEGGVAKR